MFNNIIKQAEKNGFKAYELNFQSGYYFDGKDNSFVYPCIVFRCNRDITGKELSNGLLFLEKLAKRNHLVKQDSSIYPGYYVFRYTTKELSEQAKAAYIKAVCFLEGFWMKRHDNPKATDKELIQAGHDSLLRHGYTV